MNDDSASTSYIPPIVDFSQIGPYTITASYVSSTRSDEFPYPITYHEAREEHWGIKKEVEKLNTPISSGFTEGTLKEAIADSKKVRETALHNARVALEEAFGEKYKEMVEEKKNTIKQKVSSKEDDENVTVEELDELVDELGQEIGDITKPKIQKRILTKKEQDEMDEEYQRYNEDISSKKPQINKSLKETKKLIETFREKTANYPKHISYEGSMVLCVLLSMRERVIPRMINLPSVDQELIKSIIPPKFVKELDYFEVEFDDDKDFNFKFNAEDGSHHEMIMFNSVAHPRPEDISNGQGEIRVDENGEKLVIGDKISITKMRNRFQRLAGINTELKSKSPMAESNRKNTDEDYLPIRQPVSGRNAYELRSDILQMSLDYIGNRKTWSEFDTPDKVIDVAKKFYSFVENKR